MKEAKEKSNDGQKKEEPGNGIHSKHRERMREKCIKYGAVSFQTHELLEMMLYYCYPYKNTNLIAHEILNVYGSLNALLNADSEDLQQKCGMTERISIFFLILAELMKRYSQDRWKEKIMLNSSELTGRYAISLLANEKSDCFYAILLDKQNRLINASLISMGFMSDMHFYTREIVRIAIAHEASTVVFAHNHLDKRRKPSMVDIKITIQLIRALNAIGIFVADHVIIVEDDYVSMTDLGMIKNELLSDE